MYVHNLLMWILMKWSEFFFWLERIYIFICVFTVFIIFRALKTVLKSFHVGESWALSSIQITFHNAKVQKKSSVQFFSWILYIFVNEDIYFIILIKWNIFWNNSNSFSMWQRHVAYSDVWPISVVQTLSRKISDTWLINTESNPMFSWRFYSLPHFHQELKKSKNIHSMKILLVFCVALPQLSICYRTRKYYMSWFLINFNSVV